MDSTYNHPYIYIYTYIYNYNPLFVASPWIFHQIHGSAFFPGNLTVDPQRTKNPGWRWHPKQLQTFFFSIFDPNLHIVLWLKKLLCKFNWLMTFEPFLVKKNMGPNRLIEVVFFFSVLSFQRPWFSFVVFLQRLNRGFFGCSTHPPLGTVSGCSRNGRIELVGCEPSKFVGNPNLFLGKY